MELPMTNPNTFRDAAALFAAEGWACHPLRLDENGFAKVAIVPNWQTLTPEQNTSHDWEHAAGLGIILGANSCNLAVIDIDDQELAADAAAWYLRSHQCPLMVWTARGRLHVYVQEVEEPSKTVHRTLLYKGRTVQCELRATGSYVAAPPSPRYTWANRDWEPLYGQIAEQWTKLRLAIGIEAAPQGKAAAGYPKPWQPSVGDGERNNAMFIEACRLKDAGVPYEEALEFLRSRFEEHYEQRGIKWAGLERTIKSAYNRPPKRERPYGPIGID